MQEHVYFVYVLASERNGTLYVGVTSDLIKRVQEHREGLVAGFTRKYGVKTLVYWDFITTSTRQSCARSASNAGSASGSSS
jgi:predicted GIY-YIG superfamily endonuclease